MKFSLTLAALVSLVATPVLSTVYITNPVASTTASGGKAITIEWQDDGKSPKTSDWGGYNIWLAAGSESSQFKLDQVASDLSVTRKRKHYKIPADVGPKGKYYFIRMESTKAASNGTAAYMAFSARFELDDMTGQFNSTVLAAAQGKEGAAPGASSSSAAASGTGTSSAAGAVMSAFSTSPLASASTGASNASSAAANSTSASGAEGLQFNLAALAGMGAVAAGAVALL